MATLTVQEQYCFADVVRALTGDPPAPYSELPGGRLYSFAALFAYILAHPGQFLKWAHQRLNAKEPASPNRKGDWELLKSDVHHFFALWQLALCGDQVLLRGPAELSTAMFYEYDGAGPRGQASPPPEHGYVRVRWYPDVEATRKWPDDHLGRVWVDLQRGPEGVLDLTPAISYFGMENCYVIDANRGKPQLSRRPVETLSGLAVQVLLGEEEDGKDRHEVIGIVEQPTELLQEARELRAQLDGWKYFIEDNWKLSAFSLLIEAYTYSARWFYDIAGEVSSSVMLGLLAVVAVLLYTLVDTIALVHGKVVWPLLVPIVLPVLWALIQALVRTARTLLPWIRATLEAVLLSGEEVEEWDRLQRHGSPTPSDRSESESVG